MITTVQFSFEYNEKTLNACVSVVLRPDYTFKEWSVLWILYDGRHYLDMGMNETVDPIPISNIIHKGVLDYIEIVKLLKQVDLV